MKIAPLKVSDPWYGRILNNGQIQADTLQGVPIEGTVEMELVELLHGGPESNYRPYLHLRGELTEARPDVELPYGVSELVMRRGSGVNVDAFYDFSPRQLSDLVGKGYFTEAFQVPAEMSGIPWALPGKADFLVVAPEFSDQPPVVFMNVHNQSDLALDESNSGYDLSAYFPDYAPVAESQVQAKAAEVDGPERSDSDLDMFAELGFDETAQFSDAPAPRSGDALDQRVSVPDGVFSRLVSEIKSQQVVEPQAPEDEPEMIVPGSSADLYRSRVSPGVEHVLSGEQAEAEAETAAAAAAADRDLGVEDAGTESDESVDALDLLEDEPELGLRPTEYSESAAEAHRKAASIRTARILAEVTEDETPQLGEEDQPDL